MNITLLNQGTADALVATGNGEVIEVLNGNATLDVDGPTVLIVGDKPSIREQLQTAGEIIGEGIRRLLDLIRGRAAGTHTEPYEQVTVRIDNHGPNDLRVILGDGVTDVTVAANGSQVCSAIGYLELRELGLVDMPDQHAAT